jgi:hypothetical protein
MSACSASDASSAVRVLCMACSSCSLGTCATDGDPTRTRTVRPSPPYRYAASPAPFAPGAASAPPSAAASSATAAPGGDAGAGGDAGWKVGEGPGGVVAEAGPAWGS